MKALIAAKLAVMLEIKRVEKTRRMADASGGYQYAGVEEIIAAVRPEMVKNELTIMPLSTELLLSDKIPLSNNRQMNRHIVKTTFRVSHSSGEFEDLQTFGEAAAMQDKCMNKCMTAALKYALLEYFLLQGAHDDPDDYNGPEQGTPKTQRTTKQETPPAAAKQDAAPAVDMKRSNELEGKIMAEMRTAAQKTLADLMAVGNKINDKTKQALTPAALNRVRTEFARLKTSKVATKKDQREAKKEMARQPGQEG